MLEAGHKIISITHDNHVAVSLLPSPALGPEIERVVQVDIGEQRRNHRSLSRAPVVHSYDPVFEYARLQPFTDQADDALVADAVFLKPDQPVLVHTSEKVLHVGIKYPVHLPRGDCYRQGVQPIMWASTGSKPVGEADEVAFVDGIEHHNGRALDNFVLQGSDRQRSRPAVSLRDIRPTRRLGAICSSVDPPMQLRKPRLQVCLVVLPCHTIHAGGSFALERVECHTERICVDMVEKRSEPLLLLLPCGLPYAIKLLDHTVPALCPECALLSRVSLGPRPSLHRLRRRTSGFVRRLLSSEVKN